MGYRDKASVLVRMSPRLKRKVQTEAFRSGSNMTDVINGILSDHYGVKFTPSGKRTTPFGGGRPR